MEAGGSSTDADFAPVGMPAAAFNNTAHIKPIRHTEVMRRADTELEQAKIMLDSERSDESDDVDTDSSDSSSIEVTSAEDSKSRKGKSDGTAAAPTNKPQGSRRGRPV